MSNKGFTLIELIITLSIISIMIVVVGDVYLTGMVKSKSDMAKAQLQMEGRTAVDGIVKNIKLASSVEETFGGRTSDGTHLILKIPAIKSDETFLYNPAGSSTKDYDHITYYLENKNLHKAVNSTNSESRLNSQDGSDHIILSDVKAGTLTFSYNTALPKDAKLVTISATIERTGQKELIEVVLKAEGRLRNVP